MRHPGRLPQAVVSLAMWPLTIIFFPVILLAGELVNRYAMRRVRRSASPARGADVRHGDRPARAAAAPVRAPLPVWLPLPVSLLHTAISNPLWIALTAPGRWLGDRFARVRGL